MNNHNYYSKYLKYKNKYLLLKKQFAGDYLDCFKDEQLIKIFSIAGHQSTNKIVVQVLLKLAIKEFLKKKEMINQIEFLNFVDNELNNQNEFIINSISPIDKRKIELLDDTGIYKDNNDYTIIIDRKQEKLDKLNMYDEAIFIKMFDEIEKQISLKIHLTISLNHQILYIV